MITGAGSLDALGSCSRGRTLRVDIEPIIPSMRILQSQLFSRWAQGESASLTQAKLRKDKISIVFQPRA